MGHTKKIGIAGRFGPRYGKKIRERFASTVKEKSYRCPSCLKMRVRRETAGIWLCTKCGLKFAGKAYKPS